MQPALVGEGRGADVRVGVVRGEVDQFGDVAAHGGQPLEATFGQAPVYIREGGSIPVCASFDTVLGLPVVLLGFVQPSSGAHAPNEWMDLGNYETSIRAIVRTWDELAALPR